MGTPKPIGSPGTVNLPAEQRKAQAGRSLFGRFWYDLLKELLCVFLSVGFRGNLSVLDLTAIGLDL